jgi:signal transduction histidine kinase
MSTAGAPRTVDAMPALAPAAQRADIALAAVLAVGAVLSAVLSSIAGVYGDDQASLGLAIGYAFVVSAPLAVRRRWPASVAIVVSAAYMLAVTLRIPEIYAGNIVMFIALYTVGAWSTDRRRALIVRIVIISVMFAWLFTTMFVEATNPDPALEEAFSRAGAFSPYVAFNLLQILLNALYFGGAYYFGERAWAQMRQRRVLEERTAELEREREVTAAQAVALDRVRIARELHDVVAHHVSLMGVQAGAARAVMAKDADQARTMLTDVEASARDALRELRQLLETLRAPDSDPHADTTPTARGLVALPDLVAEAASAGFPATFAVIGDPAPVPELAQVNLYRIAQEALTNARRHAGPGATADVRLRYADDAVELEVVNTGRVVHAVTAGLGQVGMRERAAVSGGTIEMSPRSRGGYLVRVRVPLTRKAAVDA